MQDFIYEGGIRILYGAEQLPRVAEEIAKLGRRMLVIPTGSFLSGGHYETLERALTRAGLVVFPLNAGRKPLLSKVQEGARLCAEKQIDVVLGIGGGVSMDLAKAIAFGARNTDVPMERFLTYEVSTDGRPMLPVVTIPTNPMSGSETNADVQITLDESGLQAGCGVGRAVFTWLNPEYVMSLPDRVLAYGQMTAFVQLSLNYLNLTRSPLAEHYAEASMKTVLECLRRSLADKSDVDARGTLLLNSALALSGINDLGRQGEFAPYPLQSFAQRYLGLDYPRALTGIFPYWLKEIYRASEDKAIFHRYFSEILGVTTDGTDEEMLLQEALVALKKLYQEFGIAFRYGELATDPQDHGRLVEIIDSFGPMPCRIMLLTTERMAKMIEDAIAGQLDECV